MARSSLTKDPVNYTHQAKRSSKKSAPS